MFRPPGPDYPDPCIDVGYLSSDDSCQKGWGQGRRRERAAPGHQPKPDVPGLWALTPTRLDAVCEEPASGSFHLSPDTVQRHRKVRGPRMKEVARHLQGQSSASNSTPPYLGPFQTSSIQEEKIHFEMQILPAWGCLESVRADELLLMTPG